MFLLAPPAVAESEPATYIGSTRCVECHPAQVASWQQSHHAQSMQVADKGTVLGNFGHAELNQHGQRTRFFRRGEKFFVRTAGADGRQQDFSIAYTFGIFPLQQYLIALPGGRLQALGVAWDARPKAQGGQRWYHLYPESPPLPGEATHWSGRDQNWNFMCASCHSTNLRKNYDLASNKFKTTWSEINVACEACHGPGSTHLVWAQGKREDHPPGLGLQARAMAAKNIRFTFYEPGQKIAALQGNPQQGQAANESCLGCHSRRQELVTDRKAGEPFLDQYQPSLIEEGLYHADGQIDGEVFEGGSYVQSAMHRAGVACSNCHEPHSLKLRASGNALCAQCHQPSHYDRAEHHHHADNSEGAQCVNCHMPGKTYMGVHVRRDHSLRIPRPAASLRAGTPNACNQCHTDKAVGWSVDALRQWGVIDTGVQKSTAAAINAAWNGNATSVALLEALQSAPSGMVKASLLALMPPEDSPQQLAALAAAAADPDGLVRLGAARALKGLSSPDALRIGLALLDDPLRAVRIEAARVLAGTPVDTLTAVQQSRLRLAVGELVQAELASAERPEAHVNLAAIYMNLGRPRDVENELLTALRLAPDFVPALVNLADWYRYQRKDGAAEPLLRRAVRLAPAAAEPAYALGLLLVRQGKGEEAIRWLEKAAGLDPMETNYKLALEIAKRELAQVRKTRSSK
jgi:predicted CXXCH cytochrome family protein